MIVLDASVVVELLTNDSADWLERKLAEHRRPWVVPHLLDVEVASALRRLAQTHRIDAHRSEQLLAELAALPAKRFGHAPLLPRMWELRHHFTCYDAAYIALAESMDAALYTRDAKLRKGHRARVVLLQQYLV